MLVKSTDDKSKRLALLEELQQSKLLDSIQKKWLRDELSRQKKGMQGERDSAHYLDLYFKKKTVLYCTTCVLWWMAMWRRSII